MTKRKSAFLIAMSGGSGSGKSTLAVALLERLGPDGSRVIGQFRDGEFQPLQPPAA
jgi:uridine kinase